MSGQEPMETNPLGTGRLGGFGLIYLCINLLKMGKSGPSTIIIILIIIYIFFRHFE